MTKVMIEQVKPENWERARRFVDYIPLTEHGGFGLSIEDTVAAVAKLLEVHDIRIAKVKADTIKMTLKVPGEDENETTF
jgi:hypothetical protein